MKRQTICIMYTLIMTNEWQRGRERERTGRKVDEKDNENLSNCVNKLNEPLFNTDRKGKQRKKAGVYAR